MLLWVMYFTGIVLHLFLQIQNSVRSNSNGLTTGWAGMKKWLQLQAVSVLVRLFFSAIVFPAALQGPLHALSGTLATAGVALPPWGLAGLAGYNVDALLNQVFGLIPWMRAEIPQLVPPNVPSLPSNDPSVPPKPQPTLPPS